MAISFHLGNDSTEIGTPSFLTAFFSTIVYHLEDRKWGTKYPEFMNELYQGKLDQNKASKVLKDTLEIRERLKEFSPKEIIWDIDDLTKRPPWGENISPHITSLANYFVTSEGKDLFEVLITYLQKLEKSTHPLTIR